MSQAKKQREQEKKQREQQIIVEYILKKLNEQFTFEKSGQGCKEILCDNFIALGHGCVRRLKNNINLHESNMTCIYKDKCGKLAKDIDAERMIGVCVNMPNCMAESLVNEANIGRNVGDKFVENVYVKEASCSMLFNFPISYNDIEYTFCKLSGLHYIDDTIIDRYRGSISLLENIDGRPYITESQVQQIFNGSIAPTANEVVRICMGQNRQIEFSDFLRNFNNIYIIPGYENFTLSAVVNIIKGLRDSARIPDKWVNIIFANCRCIKTDEGKLVSDQDYPEFKINKNVEIVSESQKNSDEAANNYSKRKTNKHYIRKIKSFLTSRYRLRIGEEKEKRSSKKKRIMNEGKQKRQEKFEQKRQEFEDLRQQRREIEQGRTEQGRASQGRTRRTRLGINGRTI